MFAYIIIYRDAIEHISAKLIAEMLTVLSNGRSNGKCRLIDIYDEFLKFSNDRFVEWLLKISNSEPL